MTAQVDLKGLVVDLSNVLRDKHLDMDNTSVRPQKAAAWDRWDRLREAWEQALGAMPEVLFVADESLEHKLDRRGSARLRTLMSRGELKVAPDADPVIISEAVARYWAILSCDRFDEHMKMPGAEQVPYFTWTVSQRGAIKIVSQSREAPLSAVMTQKRDQKERGHLGVETRAPELRFRWFCTHEQCQRNLVIWPDMRRGLPRCPDCGASLNQGDRWRTPAFELKVVYRDSSGVEHTTQRILLENGDHVELGRGGTSGAISITGVPDSDLMRISRRHLVIDNIAGNVMLKDVSSGGSALVRPHRQHRRWSPPEPLSKDHPIRLLRGQRVKLAGRQVFVELSGRKIGVPE